MKPDASEPADLISRLRQQILLAQVRVMEIEDERDAAAARLAETNLLLADAQRLADAKLDEAAHLERVRSGLEEQCMHLQRGQKEALDELDRTRTHLADLELSLRHEQEVTTGLQLQLAAQNAELRDLRQQCADLKATRSWRWTAWLRSLERTFGKRR